VNENSFRHQRRRAERVASLFLVALDDNEILLIAEGAQMTKTQSLWRLIAGALLTLLSPISAHADRVVTLQDCVSQALRHSPQLEALGYDVQAANDEIIRRRSTTLPNLSSKLDAYEVNGDPVTPFSPFNVFEPGFSSRNVHWGPLAMQSIDVTYPLFEHGSIMGLNDAPVVGAAKASLTMRQLAIILARQKIELDVASAFLSAVWYGNKLKLQEDMVSLLAGQMEGLQAQVQQGAEAKQQFVIVKIRLTALQEEISATRESLEITLTRLSDLTGGETDSGSTLDSALPPLVPLPPLDRFLSETLPLHPAMRVQEAQIQVAHEEFRAVQADRLPTVTLNSSFEAAENLEQINGGPSTRNPTALLSYLEVKVPIFDFGGRSAASDEARENYQSEKSRLREVELEIRESIAQSYGEIQEINEVLAQLQGSYSNAEESVAEIKARRTLGLNDKVAILKSEQERVTALLSLESEQFLKQLKYVELQNLSGDIWHWM
jgi:outer membrane protein TolC